jgi:hypothetical protein
MIKAPDGEFLTWTEGVDNQFEIIARFFAVWWKLGWSLFNRASSSCSVFIQAYTLNVITAIYTFKLPFYHILLL